MPENDFDFLMNELAVNDCSLKLRPRKNGFKSEISNLNNFKAFLEEVYHIENLIGDILFFEESIIYSTNLDEVITDSRYAQTLSQRSVTLIQTAQELYSNDLDTYATTNVSKTVNFKALNKEIDDVEDELHELLKDIKKSKFF